MRFSRSRPVDLVHGFAAGVLLSVGELACSRGDWRAGLFLILLCFLIFMFWVRVEDEPATIVFAQKTGEEAGDG